MDTHISADRWDIRTGFPDGLCRGFCEMYRCTADWVALKQKYLRREETTTSTNHVTNNHEISADNTDIFFLFKELSLTTTLEVKVVTCFACVKFHSPN